MKKITAAVLSVISAVSLAGCGGNAFEALYSSMDKAELNGSYGWEGAMQAQRLDFNEGALAGEVYDFDGDGKTEMAVLKITKPESDEIYAEASIEMYECEGKKAKLTANTEGAAVLSCIADAGGMEFFRIGKILVLQCAIQNNSFADGVFQNIKAYSYDGEKFNEELSFDFAGSAMEMADEADFLSDLEKIGLNGCAEKFKRDEWCDPYFSGEEGLNLALLEDNPGDEFKRLAFIYITNNASEIYENQELIDRYGFDAWEKMIIENEIMSVESGCLSEIE